MKVRFSGTLMRFVDFQREHEVAATTIASALHDLVMRYPALKDVLFTSSGSVRATHRLFHNGEQVMADQVDRAVNDRDTVEILTAIAGG